uniref:Uncharacterized protein n=1 Tax=Timema shepardi TaxID=629360 RepID=A0A7R9ANP1_TIMSH|nr:unnamed protein product [Timema shepardi]
MNNEKNLQGHSPPKDRISKFAASPTVYSCPDIKSKLVESDRYLTTVVQANEDHSRLFLLIELHYQFPFRNCVRVDRQELSFPIIQVTGPNDAAHYTHQMVECHVNIWFLRVMER